MMNEMVTIPRDEYRRLCDAAEALADLQAYDRVSAELLSGREELIPAGYLDRILAGESPLRVFRDLRGFTQQQLAENAGVNRVQIADIEAGRKRGSVETVKKLAEALRISIDDLI